MAARLVTSAERVGRAALPIGGAGKAGRMHGRLRDGREMSHRAGGIVECTQRDPSGGEMVIDAVGALGWRHGFARDPVSGARIAFVEKLARENPALGPPFVGVVDRGGVARRVAHPLHRLGDLVGAAQPLDAAEHIAGVAARLLRHRVEQLARVARFADHGGARLGDR